MAAYLTPDNFSFFSTSMTSGSTRTEDKRDASTIPLPSYQKPQPEISFIPMTSASAGSPFYSPEATELEESKQNMTGDFLDELPSKGQSGRAIQQPATTRKKIIPPTVKKTVLRADTVQEERRAGENAPTGEGSVPRPRYDEAPEPSQPPTMKNIIPTTVEKTVLRADTVQEERRAGENAPTGKGSVPGYDEAPQPSQPTIRKKIIPPTVKKTVLRTDTVQEEARDQENTGERILLNENVFII